MPEPAHSGKTRTAAIAQYERCRRVWDERAALGQWKNRRLEGGGYGWAEITRYLLVDSHF